MSKIKICLRICGQGGGSLASYPYSILYEEGFMWAVEGVMCFIPGFLGVFFFPCPLYLLQQL